MKVVFFAGGVGTRLWPVSRKSTPKQFEKIVGDKSTLQLGIDRVRDIVDSQDIYISTGKSYSKVIYNQLPEVPKQNIILEPCARDVGAAVGMVAAILSRVSPDEPFVILWSDHLVKETEKFQKILLAAKEILEKDSEKIVFIGQNSRFPSENLGWIESGDKVQDIDGLEVFRFKSLHYRPDKETAERFHDSKNHSWNPGYFVTTGRHLFSLYEKHAPEMAKKLKLIASHWGKDSFQEVIDREYPLFEKISFDNLILEKLEESDGYVIGAELGWSDIGAWEALKEALSDSEDESITKGKVLLHDVRDSIAYNYTDKMIVGIDLDGMIIVNTNDVIMICPKNSVPKIKKLVESLEGTEYEHLT